MIPGKFKRKLGEMINNIVRSIMSQDILYILKGIADPSKIKVSRILNRR